LAVPDKRYCFDYLRHETEIAEVVAAHLAGARMPQPRQILDFALNYVDIDRTAVWNGSLDIDSLKCKVSVSSALDLAHQSINGEYVDVHCWVFTPRSLGKLFTRLAHEGLIDLELVQFYDTAYGEHEFFIAMRPCNDRDRVIRSWDQIAILAHERCIDDKQTEINVHKYQPAIKFDGKIIRQPASGRGKDDGWYLVKNGRRSWITDGAWLAKNGFQPNEVIEISSEDFYAIQEEPQPLK
jgi:hypothetical protein